jgi:hypothetical protein
MSALLHKNYLEKSYWSPGLLSLYTLLKNILSCHYNITIFLLNGGKKLKATYPSWYGNINCCLSSSLNYISTETIASTSIVWLRNIVNHYKIILLNLIFMNINASISIWNMPLYTESSVLATGPSTSCRNFFLIKTYRLLYMPLLRKWILKEGHFIPVLLIFL